MASNALNKVASAMQKRAGAWEDFKAGAYSTLNNPDTWRLAATYGAPIVGGGVLGALLNRKNRLLGAALGMGGGAAVGGGLHALQAYNVGGLGDAAKKLFDNGTTAKQRAMYARLKAMRDEQGTREVLLNGPENVSDDITNHAVDPKVVEELNKRREQHNAGVAIARILGAGNDRLTAALSPAAKGGVELMQNVDANYPSWVTWNK